MLLREDGVLKQDEYDEFMRRQSLCDTMTGNKGKTRQAYRCLHSRSDGSQCDGVVEAYPGSRPDAKSYHYRSYHNCRAYTDHDNQCNPVPKQGKPENSHWTTFLEDRDDDSGHAEKLAKAMKNSRNHSLGDSDVGLFRCKKLDASENQCACCFVGRYGIIKPLSRAIA